MAQAAKVAKATKAAKLTLDMSKMSIQSDETVLVGKYSNLINASLSSHDTTLDFIFVDATTVNQAVVTGYLQARVVLSHSNIEPLIKVLQRQLDIIKSESAAAE